MAINQLAKTKKKLGETRSTVSTCILLIFLVSLSNGLNDLFREGWKHDDFFWVRAGVFAVQLLSWAILGGALSAQADSVIRALTAVEAAVEAKSIKRSHL